MSRRLHLLSLPKQSDTDALQADVMRFMAILGLCLTAVFALGQSLPDPASRVPPAATETSALPTQDSEIEQRAALLRARLQQTLERQQRIEAELADSRKLLAETRVEVERSQRYRERLEVQLDSLGAELAQRRDELRRLPTPVQVPPKVSASPTPGAASPPPPATTSSPVPRPAEAADVQAPSSRETGFTLRFASDAALSQLVREGSVRLLGMAGAKAWLLALDRGGPRFAPHPPPRSFHEMTPATVPLEYVRALGARSDAPGSSDVVWGVELPADLERRISQLLSGAEGSGALVIRADGGVELQSSDRSG